MWILSYTFKKYVGVNTRHVIKFETEEKGRDFIKTHPTIKIIFFEKNA